MSGCHGCVAHERGEYGPSFVVFVLDPRPRPYSMATRGPGERNRGEIGQDLVELVVSPSRVGGSYPRDRGHDGHPRSVVTPERVSRVLRAGEKRETLVPLPRRRKPSVEGRMCPE